MVWLLWNQATARGTESQGVTSPQVSRKPSLNEPQEGVAILPKAKFYRILLISTKFYFIYSKFSLQLSYEIVHSVDDCSQFKEQAIPSTGLVQQPGLCCLPE